MSKIAFCFLTYENLSQPKLWHDFFSNEQNRYNIYIHNKYPFTDNNYHFERYCINNRIETKYAHISVVKATIELFKNVLSDPENKYVVLLSESCIPLYNFDDIYDKIQKTDTNIIDSIYNSTNNIERFNDLTNHDFFDKNYFIKQNPCIILNRQTVEFFINNDFTFLFNDNFYAPDEHYFVNLCNKFNIRYFSSRINYAHWEWNHEGRPKTYNELTIQEVMNLRKDGYMFMRKIGRECNVPWYF